MESDYLILPISRPPFFPFGAIREFVGLLDAAGFTGWRNSDVVIEMRDQKVEYLDLAPFTVDSSREFRYAGDEAEYAGLIELGKYLSEDVIFDLNRRRKLVINKLMLRLRGEGSGSGTEDRFGLGRGRQVLEDIDSVG